MKKVISIIIILVLVGVGYTYWKMNGKGESEVNYTLSTVERGDLKNYVSCTGTLETVGSVEVGTQVSGKIESIFADFNDVVKENQILAILDTLQLHMEVQSARADLQKVEAQLELSKLKYEDNIKLHAKDFITGYDLKSSLADYKAVKASLLSAQIRLDQAKLNLNEYAFIRSPITGKIIDKEVESGQTVSASLSAPTLFVIAEDLSKMEIHAMIDETDIGQIKEGQAAEFTVDAYPDETFSGVVEEVRLQPETVSNVVNYKVIISTENKDEILLPGMTATLEILTEEKTDVLMVENSVLSYKPDDKTMQRIFSKMRSEGRGPGSGAGRGNRHSGQGQQRQQMDTSNIKMIYVLNEGDIAFVPVETGFSDGDKTEITVMTPPASTENDTERRFPELKEGSQVLKKGSGGTNTASSASSSSQNNRRPGPPGMGGGLF